MTALNRKVVVAQKRRWDLAASAYAAQRKAHKIPTGFRYATPPVPRAIALVGSYDMALAVHPVDLPVVHVWVSATHSSKDAALAFEAWASRLFEHFVSEFRWKPTYGLLRSSAHCWAADAQWVDLGLITLVFAAPSKELSVVWNVDAVESAPPSDSPALPDDEHQIAMLQRQIKEAVQDIVEQNTKTRRLLDELRARWKGGGVRVG